MTSRVRRSISVCAAAVAIAGIPATSAFAASGSGGSSSSDAWPSGLPTVDPGTAVEQGKDFLRERSPLTVTEGVDQLDGKYAALGCTQGARVNVDRYYICPSRPGTNNHPVEVDLNVAALDLTFDGTNRSQFNFTVKQL